MFTEGEHPRDKDGKFTEKGGGSSKQGLEKEVSEYKAPKGEGLAKEVSDWAERKKTESKYESDLHIQHTEAFGFANKKRLHTKDHLQHAKDMGFKNPKEYERAACDFWNAKRGNLYYSNRRKGIIVTKKKLIYYAFQAMA